MIKNASFSPWQEVYSIHHSKSLKNDRLTKKHVMQYALPKLILMQDDLNDIYLSSKERLVELCLVIL